MTYLTVSVGTQTLFFGAVDAIQIWNCNYQITPEVAIWVKYINLLHPLSQDQFYAGLLSDWLGENRSDLLATAIPDDAISTETLDRLISHLRQRFNSHFDCQ